MNRLKEFVEGLSGMGFMRLVALLLAMILSILASSVAVYRWMGMPVSRTVALEAIATAENTDGYSCSCQSAALDFSFVLLPIDDYDSTPKYVCGFAMELSNISDHEYILCDGASLLFQDTLSTDAFVSNVLLTEEELR
jgi:hypothetical protein